MAERTSPDSPAELPDRVRDYLVYRAGLLRDEAHKIGILERERRNLLAIAKQCDVEELRWLTEEVDSGDAVAQIKTFCLAGSEVPFFSEHVLYDLVGREDARSILALLRRLIERVVASRESSGGSAK